MTRLPTATIISIEVGEERIQRPAPRWRNKCYAAKAMPFIGGKWFGPGEWLGFKVHPCPDTARSAYDKWLEDIHKHMGHTEADLARIYGFEYRGPVAVDE